MDRQPGLLQPHEFYNTRPSLGDPDERWGAMAMMGGAKPIKRSLKNCSSRTPSCAPTPGRGKTRCINRESEQGRPNLIIASPSAGASASTSASANRSPDPTPDKQPQNPGLGAHTPELTARIISSVQNHPYRIRCQKSPQQFPGGFRQRHKQGEEK